tara:strand:+ start:290 stop:901 length:612 start_codon:yes stop_codon:yes gene_type:complete
MDGASFLNKFREKIQQRREARKQMQQGGAETAFNEARSEAQANMTQAGGNALMSNQMMNTLGTNNPNSNGTGSARPNFGQFAQNAIGGVMAGQKMGDVMGMQSPGMPPVDPMSGGGVTNNQSDKVYADPSSLPEQGASMGVKPKKKAKAEAKAYAAKKGLRGKARKEMIKEAKKNQSFDPATNTQSKKTEEADKKVDFTGSQS